MFLQPILMINDPDLIKDVLIKNFSHFVDRGFYNNDKIDPLSGNIFFLKGEKWKTIRAKCNYFFTPSKLRNIFPIVMEIANEAAAVADATIMKSDIIETKQFVER
jgi:cytochrome P450 family 6